MPANFPNSPSEGAVYTFAGKTWAYTGGAWKLRLADDTPEYYGAIGDGEADDTAALQAAQDSGKLIRLRSGAAYKVIQKIDCIKGFVGDGTPSIIASATHFNSTDDVTYGSLDVILYALLQNRVQFRGFRIVTDFLSTLNQAADAIACRGSHYAVVEGVEITGMNRGAAITLDTCDGAIVTKNHIHDCNINANLQGQLTAIQVDDNRLSGIASSNCEISDNYIYNITANSSFITSFGDQTDGINITHNTSYNHVIRGNRIKNVFEGIDFFGATSHIIDNVLVNIRGFAIKLPHGAGLNVIAGNIIDAVGLVGIYLGGSNLGGISGQDLVHGNIIRLVGTVSTPVSHTKAFIYIGAGGTTNTANVDIVDNLMEGGASSQYVYFNDGGTGMVNNRILHNREPSDAPTLINNLTGILYEPHMGVHTNFTPTFTYTTPGSLSVSYAERVGKAYRKGDLVYFTILLTFTPTNGTASGDSLITGIPYTALENSNMNLGLWQTLASPGAGYSQLAALLSGTAIALRAQGFTQPSINLGPSIFTSGTQHRLFISGTYLKTPG